MNNSIEDIAINAGMENFWVAVAAEFPEVSTGDFPPDAQMKLEAAMREAVALWLELNAPGGSHD